MAVLQQFGDDIWVLDGPSVRFADADLPTRMIVVKLRDGSLWVNSPVVLSRQAQDEIEAIGPVRYLVAPTALHVWRLDQARTLFPQAQLWGPPKGARRSERIAFAGLLEDHPPGEWSRDIDQLVFEGNPFIEEAEFYHARSRTLIMTDFVQNYRTVRGAFLVNLLKRIGGVLDGGVPIDIRLSFTSRKRARRSLEKLLSWDFDRLIVAHGECVDHDAKAFVEKAFGWLMRR